MDFECFNIEVNEDNYIFISCNIDDPEKLADSFFKYFFKEENIFKYFKCLDDNLIFTPTKANYVALYQNLSYFYDSNDEISNDKAGKTGEYFLSILLLDYYKYDCIIPKLIHISDQKMPIYGIDTLFYSSTLDLIMYGESKFTSDIKTGISLIEKSLAEYDKQFEDEYRFIVKNKGFSLSKNPKLAKFGDVADEALNFKKFIVDAGITQLGVPLFICHGTEIDKKIIMNELEKIDKPATISGLVIKYVVISLPIKDKVVFLDTLKKNIISKQKEYEELCK